MSISDRDLKLLWGRSGNRCAMCKCELSHDEEHANGAIRLGEQAHMVAKEVGGKRGNSILTPHERDAYANLILLCPTDHTRIDESEADYPVEKLISIKVEHEFWVQQTLAPPNPKDSADALIYSHMIDQLVDLADLRRWESWTISSMMPTPIWPRTSEARIFALADYIQRVVWPGTRPELEAAARTLSAAICNAFYTFAEHCRYASERLVGVPFYKAEGVTPQNYHQLRDQFDRWMNHQEQHIVEATKAANWFADVVRRDINPLFFALEGRFVVAEIRGVDPCSTVVTYSPDEVPHLPDAYQERAAAMQAERQAN